MKITIKAIVVVFALVLIFVSVGIPVGAQVGNDNGTTSPGEGQTLEGSGTNAVVPGGPGFIMIHPTAFVPFQQTGEYAFNSAGGALYNPGTSGSYYEAAVNLPHGAKITKVVLYYVDNSSTYNIDIALLGMNMEVFGTPNLAYLITSGADPNNRVIEDTSISSDTIDNQSYVYWIEAHLSGGQSTNLQIRGIRIDYSYPVNLPLINK